jgi:cold shock CspA family protein
MTGTIKALVHAKGYGFIAADGVDYFFHLSALENVMFKELREGLAVRFEEEYSDRGPRAASVCICVDVRDAQGASA